jgi:hypothetical protein
MKNGVLVVLIFSVALIATAWGISSRSYFSTKHPLLDQVRANFAKINPKYAEIPLRDGDSAYTENKEVITLCLINPDTKQPYDINVLMYVALHELAHVISKSQGHGDEFKNNFSLLLRKGAELGIYDPKKPIPMTYCAVKTGSH